MKRNIYKSAEEILSSDIWPQLSGANPKNNTIKNGRRCAIIRFSSNGQSQTHIFEKGKYVINDIFTFAESFLNGGTDFEWPLTQAIELIESKGFQNADIAFLTDGECAISDQFTKLFAVKCKTLNFSVTGIVMDSGIPGMTFSLEPFCRKVYRLSELTQDSVAQNIITSLAA